jgi:hypothetical protein
MGTGGRGGRNVLRNRSRRESITGVGTSSASALAWMAFMWGCK